MTNRIGAHRRREKGLAIATVLILLLIIVPTALVVYRLVNQSMRAAVFDANNRTSWELAQSALADYMRMYSSSYWDRHYDVASSSRPIWGMGKGYIQFSPAPNVSSHTVFLEATGRLGLDANNPRMKQRLTALVKFDSLLSRFMYFGVFDVQDGIRLQNGVVYGPAYFRAPLVFLEGPNLELRDGPWIFNCNQLQVTHNVSIQGDVYLTGTKTGSGTLTIGGNVFNFAPTYRRINIDFGWYRVHYTTRATQMVYWVFNADGTYQACYNADVNVCNASNSWSPPQAIPASGGIFLAEANVGVWGTIARPVTVVSAGDGNVTDTTNGMGYVMADIKYPGGTHNASPNHSFAFLVDKNIISYNLDGDGVLEVNGIEYSNRNEPDVNHVHVRPWDPAYITGGNPHPNGSWPHWTAVSRTRYDRYGSPLAGAYLWCCWVKPPGGYNFYYDPQLRPYPPPGMPEVPYLVNWDMKEGKIR